MDVEALQAQIDLSNSIAYDLVSSWVKPSTNSTTPVSLTMARELEEYAKRPPRLGLGATVSQSSLVTSREAARLKGRLVGQKRRRDQSDDLGRSSAQKPHYGEEVEDEDESRSAAISTKKSRVNRSLGKESEAMEVPINSKKQSAEGDSLTLPGSPIHVSVGAHNQTLPTTSPVELRPPFSLHEVHSPMSSQSAPLLNLHGPPLVQVENDVLAHSQEESATAKKKKRKRRRGKRRKSHGGEGAV